MISVSLPIIAHIHSPYREKFGIPRQPNLVQVQSRIRLCPPYDTLQALKGIQEFSHLWLIWQFHENKNQTQQNKFRPQIRPPRLGGNEKIGVFASRSMYRPAPIGLSVVKLVDIEQNAQGVWLVVEDADLLDGTPILDIKPYLHYADAIQDAKSSYAQHEPPRLSVIWSPHAEQLKQNALAQQLVSVQHFTELEQVLSLDPRPAYQNDTQRIYAMKFANLDVKFRIAQQLEIIDFTIE
ncbi:MAG: tRNA (N6-threonylcarbamoyladenosine(37)-N6)-methyltransferase TrmO [Acinetobacter sp.]|nr:tRNA (N6-threonylcarbamoyladenosine(37)-N6)-methyltransferase TrmO [Acinetobacter sp.]